ncbi:LysM peptidoglycan-binding domain-containing protein [Thiotrichales bacterium HSG1]|nr:LysM peptidoglycan-binding domain-containing protein [Thiotrichales bacterium HSG1]
MELFFYSSDKEVPFETLYDSLDSQGNKLLVSNFKEHIAKFVEKDLRIKERILDILGNDIIDKKILVPKEVKEIFLEWIQETYNNSEWTEGVFNIKDFYFPGADNINNFIQEIKVENTIEYSSEPDFFQTNQKKDELDRKEYQNFVIIFAILLSFIFFAWVFSDAGDKYEQAKLDVQQGKCEEVGFIERFNEPLKDRVDVACKGLTKIETNAQQPVIPNNEENNEENNNQAGAVVQQNQNELFNNQPIIIHIVQQGETTSDIANHYKISIEDIVNVQDRGSNNRIIVYNELNNPEEWKRVESIRYGWKIKIPVQN